MWTDHVATLRREFSVFDAVLTGLLIGAVYLFTDDPWTATSHSTHSTRRKSG